MPPISPSWRSRGERVPHVDHGHDSGGQRDLLPGEAVGVAVAVEALVALVDDLQGPAQRRTSSAEEVAQLVPEGTPAETRPARRRRRPAPLDVGPLARAQQLEQ